MAMRGSFQDFIKTLYQLLNSKLVQRLWTIFRKDPRNAFAFTRATVQTLWICHRKFGSKHFGSSKENAYRHALWSLLLAKYSYSHRPYDWAYEMGKTHESLFANEERDRQMDLHNNQVGIEIIKRHPQKKMAFYNESLEEAFQHALQISHDTFLNDIENAPHRLVYY